MMDEIEIPNVLWGRALAEVRQMQETTHKRESHQESKRSWWLTNFAGLLGQYAFSLHMGFPVVGYDPYGRSHPHADIKNYEVRTSIIPGSPSVWVYPREVKTPGLIIVQMLYHENEDRVFMAGWIRASEAGSYPIPAGKYLQRHKVPITCLHENKLIPCD